MIGKLLVSHPNLPKNNPFHNTVIYIFQHNHQGSQGLIINKPSDFPVSQFVKSRGWHMELTKETMRYGGPINSKTVVMIHTDDWYSSNTEHIANGISVSCDDFMFEKIASGNAPGLWRMTVGLCAWQPGQLDLELSGKYPYRPENSWLTVDANKSIMFEHDGDKQWEKALNLSSRQLIDSYL